MPIPHLLANIPEIVNYPSLEKILSDHSISQAELSHFIGDEEQFKFEEAFSGNDFGYNPDSRFYNERFNLREKWIDSLVVGNDAALERWFNHLGNDDRGNVSWVLKNLVEKATSDVESRFFWLNAVGSTTLLKRPYGDIDLLLVTDHASKRFVDLLRENMGLFFNSQFYWLSKTGIKRNAGERVDIAGRIFEDELKYTETQSGVLWSELPEFGRGVLTLTPHEKRAKKIQIIVQDGIQSPWQWAYYERRHVKGDEKFREQCKGIRIPLVLLSARYTPLASEEQRKDDKYKPYFEWLDFMRMKGLAQLPMLNDIYYSLRENGPMSLHPTDLQRLVNFLGVPPEKIPSWLPQEDFERLEMACYDAGGFISRGQMPLPYPAPLPRQKISNSDEKDRVSSRDNPKQYSLFIKD
jgi:hypothetical protein